MTLPTQEEILSYLRDIDTAVPIRAIIQAFDVDRVDRPALRKLVKQMGRRGQLDYMAGHRVGIPKEAPNIHVLVISSLNDNGDLQAHYVDREQEEDPHLFTIAAEAKGASSLRVGDTLLAKISDDTATFIKKLDSAQNSMLGIARIGADGRARLEPLNERSKESWHLNVPEGMDLHDGQVVRANLKNGEKKAAATVTEILGHPSDPRLISLISIAEAGLSTEFPAAALKEAKAAALPKEGEDREDLTGIPLVTIDGPDARDFDDAVFAEPDTDIQNPGGHHIIVAIADVSYYVREGSALDKEARKRGNSTYFPDRVIPMLPEALSNDLCSLMPNVPRACLHAHIWIDSKGELKRYKFRRGLMKSAARLTYEQVQKARDGAPDEKIAPLMQKAIEPLYTVFKILLKAREERNALEIETIERKVLLNADGEMAGVTTAARYDSHKLIEEMMILANVAAAKALESKSVATLYRVHEKPKADRLATFADFLKGLGFDVPLNASLDGRALNEIQHSITDESLRPLISTLMLRTQSQAKYQVENLGHFGLALQHYAHFTSPIRRYADLAVHRGLVRAFELGEGKLSDAAMGNLQGTGEHISQTERLSSEAERQTVDRFTARFMADRVGAEFDATISSVTKFGLFVTLDETGADGLIPMRHLPGDFYEFEERRQRLVGRRSGKTFTFGDRAKVRLIEVQPLAGLLSFEMVHHMPNSRSSGRRDRSDDRRDNNRGGRESYGGGQWDRKSLNKKGGKDIRKTTKRR